MITTTLDGIANFLNFWNNEHLSTEEDNAVPVNMYNMAALSTGVGFTLKWFVSKSDFDKIAEDVNYIFDDDKNRMLLIAGEDRIELEIDEQSIITDFKEEVKDIDVVFEKMAEHKTS